MAVFVTELAPEFHAKLREVLENENWIFSELQYAVFKATHEKTSVALYNSGKLVVQGSNPNDFVEFILEPKVLKSAVFSAARMQKTVPHAGMDESGKGDFFGPLCICAAYVDEQTAQPLAEAGVKDCKLIKNDAQLIKIADQAIQIIDGRAAVVTIGPEAYNRMYRSFGNLNKLLAWGHARALENLLEKVPDCNHAIADQFGNEILIKKALKEKGKQITLEQKHKAESDIAVALASVLARAAFLKKLQKLSDEAGFNLPKGAGSAVDETAKRIVVSGGAELLSKFSKMHFKNAYKALDLPIPQKTFFKGN